jgi:hypothetical protein
MTMSAPVTLFALSGRAHLPLWLGVFGVAGFAEQASETITFLAPQALPNLAGQ